MGNCLSARRALGRLDLPFEVVAAAKKVFELDSHGAMVPLRV